MAIDPGSVRVGVAVSDEGRVIAQPHSTIARRGEERLLRQVAELARAQAVVQLVVGLPLRMDGTEGPEAESARQLGRQLARATGLPVSFADERLTSRQAEREMIAAGSSRRRRRQVGDQVAAALLLQGVLAGARTHP